MEICPSFSEMPLWAIITLCVVALWDMVWKLVALWRSAKNSQPVWFVFLAVLNTVGILPIIYILTHKKRY